MASLLVLTWKSSSHVRQGDQTPSDGVVHNMLEIHLVFLGMLRQVNDTRKSSSNSETFATLTKNEVDNGVRVLQSTLRIKASLSLSSASVTCVHTDASNSRSISFTVLRTYV